MWWLSFALALEPVPRDACDVPEAGAFAASILREQERDPAVLDVDTTPATLTVTHAHGIDGLRLVRTNGHWPVPLRVSFAGFGGLEAFSLSAVDPTGQVVPVHEDVYEQSHVHASDGDIVVTIDSARLPRGTCALRVGWVDFFRL